MRCEEPIGHAAIIAGLWHAARSDRLAHALCFSGPSGIGKFLAAEWLALGLVCRPEGGEPGLGSPCGVCGPCKRARADTHPDLFVIDLESENRDRDPKDREEQIRVQRIARRDSDGVATLSDFLALRAAEGGYRLVLVREADRANEEAQNALLKTLEEPGEHTLIVLETARAETLLPTIRSRCLRVQFQAPAPSTTAAILAARGFTPAEAEALARWSGGAPGLAASLHARGIVAMRVLLERVMSGAIDAFAAAAELSEIEGDFQSKTAVAGERIRARTFLDLALSVLRDRERAAAGLALAGLAHGDLVERLPEATSARRALQLEQCLRARQDVEHNLAPEAAVERALLALDGASQGAFVAC